MSDWWSADPVAAPADDYGKRISSIESGGNYKAVGPETGKGRALGKYQVMDFNVGPWSREALGREMTPQEFLSSPDAQEAVFKNKFGGYVQKYGPEGAARAWFAGEKGMNNPNARDVLGTTVSDYSRKFVGQGPLDASSVNRQPQANWWANDPVSTPQTEQQPAPQQQQPQVPLPQPRPAGLGVSPEQQLSIENQNQQIAGGQGTTPQMDLQRKNLISDQVFENDAGLAVFRDPQSGQLVEAQDNKHVILRDPQDNQLKVFARSDQTNENKAVSVSRILAPGLATNAPASGMAQTVRLKQAVTPLPPRALTAGEQVAQAGQNLADVGTSGAVNVPKAVASDSMAVQRAGATVAQVPVAGNPLVEAAGNTTKQLATKSQEIAAEYGSASTITAGDTAAAAIKDYIGVKSKDAVTKLYNAVDNLVNPAVKTELTETAVTAQSILSRRANAAITEPSQAVRKIEEAVTKPDGLNYEGVKDLRTYIGELLDRPSLLPADISGKELKQIYGALSKDLRTAVENAGGPRALSAFERANKYKSLVSDRNESLAKIVGADGSAPAAQVFDRLVGMAGNTTRADMAKLAQARKAMGPDAWNEVASGVISQMGRVQDATGNVIFSPQRFLTAYQDKLSAPGRAMLFRTGGKDNIAPYLDDIAAISSRFRELQKFSNPSGTGQALSGVGTGFGLFAAPLPTIGAAIGANLLARALAAPATVAPVAQWSRKYELVLKAPTPANVAQLTIASRNLANTINSQFGVSIAWQDLLKATQGSVKGRAEDEQNKP